MKKAAIAVCLIMTAVFARAEILSKVAVVDIDSIATSYFGESQTVREITRLQEQYENEMAVQQDKLERLRDLKFQAEKDGDTRKALSYDDQINQQQEYMQEYHSVMTNRIKSKSEKLSESTSFAEEILKVIEYIAINEGFSIVMDSKNPYIWWYNPEADITDLVIERLQQLARINQAE